MDRLQRKRRKSRGGGYLVEVKTFIGIDPDLKASGVAIFRDGALQITTLDFPQLLAVSKVWDEETEIRIEAGWLNKSNFHIKPGMSLQVAAEVGRRVGENHATGKLLAECLSKSRATVKLVRPTNKKITEPSVFEKISGIKTLKKEQDKRDSAMLLFDIWKDKLLKN